MIYYLLSIDKKIMDFLNKKFRYNLLDIIMPIITALGNGGMVWILISLYLMIDEDYRIEGFMIAAALIITTFIGEGIIKHLIKRTRPFVNIKCAKLLVTQPMTYSFPSGHTASSFASAGIFIMMNSRLSIFAVILAALIAFSRVYLNVHYPTDVVTGIILGLLCSWLVIAIFQSETMLNWASSIRSLVNSI